MLVFHISKFQKQIRFFDLVRAPKTGCDREFLKRKVQCEINREVRTLENNRSDVDFLKEVDATEYRSLVGEIITKTMGS